MTKTLLCLLTFFAWAGAAHGMPALSKEFEDYVLVHHYIAVALNHGLQINEQTVDAQINGQKVTLLVDTGCPRTLLTARSAERLHLNVRDTGKADWGVGGEITGHRGIALIQSFALAIGEVNRTNTILVLSKGAHLDGSIDGILGLDVLALNAAIFPVGGSGLLIKPGPLPAVSIADYLKKLGYTPAPFSIGTGAIMLDGHINGQSMRFKVDSGAAFSTFDEETVRAAMGHDLTSTELPMEGLDAIQR